MASTDHSQQSEATSFLAWADEKLFKMETAFNLTSAMLILFLMFLAVVQVVGRKFFNFPIELSISSSISASKNKCDGISEKYSMENIEDEEEENMCDENDESGTCQHFVAN